MRVLFKCFMLMGILLVFTVASVLGDNCFQCVVVCGGFGCAPSEAGAVDCWVLSNQCTMNGICSPGSGCFLPGTLIETDGGMKAIEELRVGDKVLGLDGSDGEMVCDVEKTYKSLQCSYYVINGKLRVTGTHPFYVDNKWIEASEIKVGNYLKGKGSESILVETIEMINKGVRVYNIEVADAHTFYAEGALVHNKDPDPTLP